MYQPETILALKEPRSTKEDPFPYDRVRVIGQSPIDHGLRSQAWEGANGQGVLLSPLTSFGANLDEPYGKVKRLYDVESVPPPVEIIPPKVLTQEEQGPSPEDVFAAASEARGENDGRDAEKVRVLPSPLGEDPPEEVVGPLGEVEGDAEPEETNDSPL